MSRTLLIGNPATTWREWLKAHRGGRDLLCLDPSDPQQGIPGRLTLLRGDRPIYSRFYGSLDPQRAPHVLFAALVQALTVADDDVLIQGFPYRPTPVLRQVLFLLTQLIQPDEIVVAMGSDLDLDGFPVGPEEVQLEKAFPAMVLQAQRKALWLRQIERCEPHEVRLNRVTLDGVRLGSGVSLTAQDRERVGLADALHAERNGKTLLVVAEYEPTEDALMRALDGTGCARAHFAHPESYGDLMCSFAHANGEDFGYGFLREIDWENGLMKIDCDAVPPAPVRLLRLGALRVDRDGNELGELKPWQV